MEYYKGELIVLHAKAFFLSYPHDGTTVRKGAEIGL